MNIQERIAEVVSRSRRAQAIFENYSQAEVDRIVRDIAKSVYARAEELARMAVEETRMGVYEDKVRKNQGKARILWHSLKGRKTIGIIHEDKEKAVIEVARPMGVVGAVTPCTNPIVTPMCNAMFALKCRNSIIFAPHPRAVGCTATLTRTFRAILAAHGAPEDLVQDLPDADVEATGELMRQVDIIIATGGMGMVRAAYSSGKPAYGVGAGNVQCIVDRGVDIPETVTKIIAGRTFDNGIICSGEQSVILPDEEAGAILAEFARQGAVIIEETAQVARLRDAIFKDGIMNKHLVGQPVEKVAETAGIAIPPGSRVLLVKAEGIGREDLLSKEKMCAVISVYTYQDFEEALDIAEANLDVEGKGHSVSIHSNDRKKILKAAERLKVCRILVNQICSTMNGGSFLNGFAPTTKLGCGTWGNNILSENLDCRHLLNITRIGSPIPNARIPSDEEIWGE
ncbi:MAG TPA: succinate-semialdehyde dehydrogenase [Clostridiales bacterium]|nr:succinate-semialdehyde dehydrogenase [Clostridiales bacterium]